MHALRPAALLKVLMLLLATGCGAASPVADAPTQPPLETTAPSPVLAEPITAPDSADSPPKPPAPDQPSPTDAAAAPAIPVLARRLMVQEPRLTGDDVLAVQQRLLDRGYAQVGVADGIYGPATERAVRAFQQASGLEADGIVGPQTWERLWSAQESAESAIAPLVYTGLGSTGYLLGGARDGAWIDAMETVAALRGGETYRRYDMARETGVSIGAAPESAGIPCEDTFLVTLDPQPQEELVALGGAWDARPRVASDADDQAAQYTAVIAALLQAEGLAQPDVQIRRVLRVDLEGDGTEETLVSASRLAEARTTIAAGDYSLIALVRAEDPTQAVKIVGESYRDPADFGASVEYTIDGLLDLNGDGILDLVVGWSYYEGAGALVFDMAGGQPQEALAVGCGV